MLDDAVPTPPLFLIHQKDPTGKASHVQNLYEPTIAYFLIHFHVIRQGFLMFVSQKRNSSFPSLLFFWNRGLNP